MHDRHHAAMIQKFAKPGNLNQMAVSQSETVLPSARGAKRRAKNPDQDDLLSASNDVAAIAEQERRGEY